MSRTWKVFAGSLAVLGLLGAGCAASAPSANNNSNNNVPPVPEKPAAIKIGFIAPLSGSAAGLGEEMRKVVSYQTEQANKQSGAPIEVMFEDGKCSGADAVSAFQKLTDTDGVKYVIGGACSSETLAMAPLAAEKKVLTISGVSSNPEIEGKSQFVFTLSYNDNVIAQGLAKAVNATATTVAIITEQNDFNVGVRQAFLNSLTSSTEVVADETFPKDATDFRSLLAKVEKAKPRIIVLNPNVGVTAKNLLWQIAERKAWKGSQLYTQFAYLSDNSREGATSTSEGMIIVDTPRLTNEGFLTRKASLEQAQGVMKELGVYYTASTMDAADLAFTLAREFGSDTTAAAAALGSRVLSGNIGEIRFDGKSFVQNIESGVFIVKDNKAEPVVVE